MENQFINPTIHDLKNVDWIAKKIQHPAVKSKILTSVLDSQSDDLSALKNVFAPSAEDLERLNTLSNSISTSLLMNEILADESDTYDVQTKYQAETESLFQKMKRFFLSLTAVNIPKPVLALTTATALLVLVSAVYWQDVWNLLSNKKTISHVEQINDPNEAVSNPTEESVSVLSEEQHLALLSESFLEEKQSQDADSTAMEQPVEIASGDMTSEEEDPLMMEDAEEHPLEDTVTNQQEMLLAQAELDGPNHQQPAITDRLRTLEKNEEEEFAYSDETVRREIEPEPTGGLSDNPPHESSENRDLLIAGSMETIPDTVSSSEGDHHPEATASSVLPSAGMRSDTSADTVTCIEDDATSAFWQNSHSSEQEETNASDVPVVIASIPMNDYGSENGSSMGEAFDESEAMAHSLTDITEDLSDSEAGLPLNDLMLMNATEEQPDAQSILIAQIQKNEFVQCTEQLEVDLEHYISNNRFASNSANDFAYYRLKHRTTENREQATNDRQSSDVAAGHSVCNDVRAQRLGLHEEVLLSDSSDSYISTLPFQESLFLVAKLIHNTVMADQLSETVSNKIQICFEALSVDNSIPVPTTDEEAIDFFFKNFGDCGLIYYYLAKMLWAIEVNDSINPSYTEYIQQIESNMHACPQLNRNTRLLIKQISKIYALNH